MYLGELGVDGKIAECDDFCIGDFVIFVKVKG